MSPDPMEARTPPSRPPISNVPPLIWVFIFALVGLHTLRVDVLSPLSGADLLLDFAFIPGCLGDLDEVCFGRSAGANLWSFASYSFLHGDWLHVGANSLWLLAFGTPALRRIGTLRFLAFCLAGAVAGAGAFYLLNPTLIAPVIGASGIVSALMGGACRFAFGSGGVIAGHPRGRRLPLLPIAQALSNRTVLVFVVAFFATNLVVGSGVAGSFGGGEVAWEAHLGGFAFGFLFFRFFDRTDGRG